MSARINLLPDLRQAKIADKRHRTLAVTLGSLICGISLVVLILLFGAVQVQALRSKSLSSSIHEKQAALLNEPEIVKILTTQQHLASLQQLVQQRVYMTKFFAVLGDISPKDASLVSLTIDPGNALRVVGRARNYAVAAKFAQALEADNVTIGPGASPSNSANFSDVTLSAVSAGGDGRVDFSLSAVMSAGVTNGSK